MSSVSVFDTLQNIKSGCTGYFSEDGTKYTFCSVQNPSGISSFFVTLKWRTKVLVVSHTTYFPSNQKKHCIRYDHRRPTILVSQTQGLSNDPLLKSLICLLLIVVVVV